MDEKDIVLRADSIINSFILKIQRKKSTGSKSTVLKRLIWVLILFMTVMFVISFIYLLLWLKI